MAIAVDASTPAGASQTNANTATVVSASFTPPSGSVILICWQGNTAATAPSGAPTISNTGSQAFTLVNHRFETDAAGKEGQCAMWRAVSTGPGSMTVTVTTLTASGDRQARVKPIVLTGVDTSNPAGWQAGEGTDTIGALDGLTYTSTSANSMGFASVSDWDTASAVFTAAAGTTIVDSTQVGASINCATLRQTTPTTSGSTISLGLTSPTSSTWNYVWIELPAAVGGTAVSHPPTRRPAAALGALLDM